MMSASGTKRTGAVPLSMQAQREMKLARYDGKRHVTPPIKSTGERRDCTMVASTDYLIPEGFRGG